MTDTVNVPRVWLEEMSAYLGATDQNDWSGLKPDDAMRGSYCLRVGVLMELRAMLHADPKAEPVSDPYKLVTAADIIAWVKNHPHQTSWVATATDIKTIVETMKPDQLPEAPKVEQKPVAWRAVCSDGTPYGEIYNRQPTDRAVEYHADMGRSLQPLYTHPAPASAELLEVLWPNFLRFCAAVVADEYPGTSQSLHDYAIKQSDLLAKHKHKGPQS